MVSRGRAEEDGFCTGSATARGQSYVKSSVRYSDVSEGLSRIEFRLYQLTYAIFLVTDANSSDSWATLLLGFSSHKRVSRSILKSVAYFRTGPKLNLPTVIAFSELAFSELARCDDKIWIEREGQLDRLHTMKRKNLIPSKQPTRVFDVVAVC